MDEGAARSAVAVRKGMDRLELGVRNGRQDERGDVVPAHERHQVTHRCGHALVVRGDERRVVGPEVAAAHPDLLLTPVADPLGMRRPDEHLVHVEDRLLFEVVGQGERGLHRSGVRHDDHGVVPRGITQLGECDRFGRGRQVLDLRRGGRLRTQQQRGVGRDVGPHLGVEAGDLGGRLVGERQRLTGQWDVAMGDLRRDRGLVGARVGSAAAARDGAVAGKRPRP